MSDYDANKEFRRQLKLQGQCCCCNAFVWANFWLLLWLAGNIVELLWYAAMVYILEAPYNTVEWVCWHDGVSEKCDPREMFEDVGFTMGWAIAALVVQCLVIILNVLGFVGLWNCISWMLCAIVVLGFVNLVWALVYWALSYQYWYIFWLIVPMILLCFFTMIYQKAAYHERMAQHRGYRDHNENQQPV